MKNKTIINLLYRLKRFFDGESGIVEKVEPAPFVRYDEKEDTIDRFNYSKDYFGNLPSMVTFKNSLGELVKRLSPITTEALPDNTGLYYASAYKNYKVGDNFP